MNSTPARIRFWSQIDAAGVLIAAALIGLFYLAALRPLLAHQLAQQELQQQLLDEKKQAVDAATELESARDKLEAVNQAVAASPLKLQPVDALNDRLAQISKLATACGLNITNIRPDSPVAEMHYSILPIALGGAGGYRNCTLFLRDLHDQLPDTGVGTLKLSAGADSSSATFQIELRWFAAQTAAR